MVGGLITGPGGEKEDNNMNIDLIADQCLPYKFYEVLLREASVFAIRAVTGSLSGQRTSIPLRKGVDIPQAGWLT